MSQEASAAPPSRPGDAFCFRVKEEREAWSVLLPIPSRSATDISRLAVEAPEFLGMDGSGPAVRLTVPVPGGDQSGCRVMAAIDEVGGIMVVGCPLKGDRAACTALVRETIAWYGRFWRMTYEQFDAMAAKVLGRPLVDSVAEASGAQFDEAKFRAGIVQVLDKGRFPVIILLDKLDGEATEALTFLRSLDMDLKVFGVELYESWGVEVALPKLLSVGEPARESGSGRGVARPAPPPGRQPPPPRFLTSMSTQNVAQIGRPEPQPEPPVQQEWKPTPNPERPWATQPAPKIEPSPEPRPVQAAPSVPPPRPSASTKTVWDGSMPGVMAGKRPPPKPADDKKPGKR